MFFPKIPQDQIDFENAVRKAVARVAPHAVRKDIFGDDVVLEPFLNAAEQFFGKEYRHTDPEKIAEFISKRELVFKK